ncbi:MAG: hypothetical protein DA328_08505 [Nitrososphaeraceae archaeon]|nr:hypothetical protein [Nitrososphaeraceae archaeon]
MNRLACERVRETLRAHVAGELDDAERTAVETHIAGCPPCSAEVAQERALAEMLEPTNRKTRKIYR